MASTPVYVRFDRDTEGMSSGDIAHVSAGAVTRNLAVTGTAAEQSATPISFTGKEFLGRPTDTSMAVKVVPDQAISLFYEYGTSSGQYPDHTATETATAGQPKTMVMDGLTANTKYYYRMKYSTDDGATWVTRDQHSFWTQRASGSTFTFDVTTDGHVNIMLGNSGNWQRTLDGVASDSPDFDIDLGDTVAMDNGSSSVASVAAAEQVYENTLPYLNTVSASAPLFMVAGNHEQQEAWHGVDSATSLPVMGKNAEKKFFLNPIPGVFYDGDSRAVGLLSDDHLVQDYYSWTWGDALFVVISPFWTTTTKPYTTSTGGGEGDTTGSGDRWDWTLGADQLSWLKTTLAGSNAKYKFVFAHQIVGGNSMTNQVNYGHGGVDSANFVEWGGYDTNGTTFAWNTHRDTAVWGSQPIREMMETNGVTAFFHGHDHQMAYETANGMVYQACPSASFSGSFGNYSTGNTFTVRDETGGTSTGRTVWADSNQGAGRLRVTVNPDEAQVDFVRYNQTSAAYSYTLQPTGEPSTPHLLTYSAGTHGSLIGTSPQIVADGGEGTPVQAIADPGYHFVEWSDGQTENPRTDTDVTEDITVTAQFAADPVQVTVDGTPTSGKGANAASSVTFSHTTGTGINRLMLVGVSWNCGTTNRTVSSVTFTPSGGSAIDLTEVQTQLGYNSTNPRYSAIYRLLAPPSGVSGMVTVTFSGAVSNGSVAGAADFAGVDQTTPLGTPGGTGTSSQATTASVTLGGLTGNELVFDNVFAGAGNTSQTLTAATGQTGLWNVLNYTSSPVTNLIAAASTRQVADSSTTMSWTAASTTYWAIAAVPIRPAVPTCQLTLDVAPSGGGSTAPDVGTHSYPEGNVVGITATPSAGYAFDYWTGDVASASSASTTVTMDSDKAVTAHFVALEYTLTANVVGQGSVDLSPDQTTYHYGDEVTLTATPADGYEFAGWSGDLADGVNPQTLTMNGDKTLTATFEKYVRMPLGVDGASTSGTGAANASSVSFSHVTGTGTDRLMLVGVSWNCGTAARTITSATFTPTGGPAIDLAAVKTQQAGAQLRYSAIYRLLSPPKGVTGTVDIVFSGAVSNGIVAGAVDFAGVDQNDPLGTAVGAGSDVNDVTPTVALDGLRGDEIVFDNVFQGGSSSSQTLTPGAGQTSQWNAFVSNTRAAASTKQAAGDAVTMSWTAASESYWAIAAVPVNPLPVDAETPQISAQPSDVSVGVGDDATLSVTASVARGTLSYQWYESADRSNSNGSPVAGATESSFAAPTGAPGTTYYYYCVITNTDTEATGSTTASIASDAAEVRGEADRPGRGHDRRDPRPDLQRLAAHA